VAPSAQRPPIDDPAATIAALQTQLDELGSTVDALRRENTQLRAQLDLDPPDADGPADPSKASQPRLVPVSGRTFADHRSSGREKIAVYRSLVIGRDDVYARRWENTAEASSGWWPVHRGTKHTPRHEREYLPLTDDVLRTHLEGGQTIGLYPLLDDDTCWLLAVDFDGTSWRLDARAYVEAAEAASVPTAVEVSRSGDGAHVWTFFTAPVAASEARAMGAALLREAMALRGELDLGSYDRLFPSQDHLPRRGFGNLIALPLQGERRREHHTTVFVDVSTFDPWPDQFAFLSTVTRMTPKQVQRAVTELAPVVVGPDTVVRRSSLRPEPPPPETIEARFGAMLAVRRAGIPPSLYASLKHLATLHNPAFHKNERLRLSNHETPRFVKGYLEDLEHLYLPRGSAERATTLVAEAGSHLEVVDERADPAPIEVRFDGELSEAQEAAVAALARHDLGVLEAPPGAGKTVMGCALIHRYRTPTLVLVDRTHLLDQWREHLRNLLGVEPGQIGGGKKRATGIVDIAMVQTVTRSERPSELLAGYGLAIVDECHHAGAPTVERTVRTLDARRWVGLTATPQRSDGLTEIMLMQCGPIRHRVPLRTEGLVRTVHVHPTELRVDAPTDGLSRPELEALVNTELVADEVRNIQVCRDVADAVERGRNVVVLTGRTEHVETLADMLRHHGLAPQVLYGSLTPKQRKAVHDLLSEGGQTLLVATDRYIGEGFDCPRLDTLFLAFPVASPHLIVQYVGRILREHPGKDDVEVHDYLDVEVAVAAEKFRKRRAGYTRLGFDIKRPGPSRPRARAADGDRRGPAGANHEEGAVGATDQSQKPADGPDEPTATQVRAWARASGYDVGSRGRLAAEIWQAYRASHR